MERPKIEGKTACGNDCGVAAEVQCMQCQAAFCSPCFELIHLKSAFKSHEAVDLSKLMGNKLGCSNECKLHKKELELYCSTCLYPICLKCYSFGDHQGHVSIPISDHASFAKTRLTELLPECSTRSKLLETASNEINSMIEAVNEV